MPKNIVLVIVSVAILLLLIPLSISHFNTESIEVEQKTIEKDPRGEKNRIELIFEGNKAFINLPDNAQNMKSIPWVWYAPTFIGLPDNPDYRQPSSGFWWLLSRLQEKGFAIAGVDTGDAMGSPEGRKIFSKFYNFITKKYNLAPKACLLAQSRGGLEHYNWAIDNANCVRCIGGFYPVVNSISWPGFPDIATQYKMDPGFYLKNLHKHNPISRILTPLTANKIRVLHLHGDKDKVVPLEENSSIFAKFYTAFGGDMEVIVIKDEGHGGSNKYFENQNMLDFFLSCAGDTL